MEGVEKRGARGGGGQDSAGLSSLQFVSVLERSRRQDKGMLGLSGAARYFYPVRKREGAEIPQETLLPWSC